MRDSVMWFLVTSVVVSALFVVNVRHEHRIAYVAFQTEQARRCLVYTSPSPRDITPSRMPSAA